jgi:hypothetical protein
MTEDRGVILFSNLMMHSEFKGKFGKIKSAGFCNISDNKIECYGESISLNIKSNKNDADLINRQLRY